MGTKTYRRKHKELRELQKGYYDYLINSEDPLTMDARLKLINEISRIDRQIRSIETMNLVQLEQPVLEWEVEMNSELNKRPFLEWKK